MGLLDNPQAAPQMGLLNTNQQSAGGLLGPPTPNPEPPPLYQMRVINGRQVFFDRAGNVAAYQDDRGTLVPGPSVTVPNIMNGYTPEQIRAMGRGQVPGLTVSQP